ncbi:hypothetical protein [Segetibacter aerophilus]|uniref:Uncharacterized protein n=1 Tax=Segetibacter aerophilus TaxID=670293 RepID=A0A512BIP6_9BACT|nr:hypothetical protein [Segetibacter aerophilus]GEO11831.1 hypothetical protein SAE01_43270 [Segetibacter aerophilus]
MQNNARNFVLLVVCCLLSCYGVAQNEAPFIGSITTVRTTVCRLDITSKSKLSINNIYAPTKGWQILAFKPVVIENTEKAAYAFSPIPVHFAFKSTSAIYSKFIQLFEFAAEKNVFEKYETKITQMRNDFEKYSKNNVPLYSSIRTTGVVKVKNTARSKAGRLYVDLIITLIYLPATQEEVLQSLEEVRQMINDEN